MQENKTALVTGATSGIGKVTALELARRGWNVLVGARNEKKARRAVEDIRAASANARVADAIADFSSLDQVRSMAQEILAQHDRLDVLVNNAGGAFLRRQITEEGHEMTLAVNHLAPYLLTNMLLPILAASDGPRVVNVSSASHYRADLDFDDLHSERRYGIMRAYGRSKLANVLFTYELDRRFDAAVNAVHPGLVATNMGANNGLLARLVVELTKPMRMSAEQGAKPLVFLASAEEAEGVSGQYFNRMRPARSSSFSYDQDAAKRLWEISAELVDWPSRRPAQ